MRISVEDRIKGLVYGHALGDAIGLGTEFMNKRQIKIFYPNGYSSYAQTVFDKHRSRWQKGEWTDDTDQMLCILESILNTHQVDEIDVARRIHHWAYTGGRGLGQTVYAVITSPRFLLDPHEVAREVWVKSGKNNAANGAIMRTSILGAWDYKDQEKVKANTEKIAKITHFDPRCIGSCVVLTTAISKLLSDECSDEQLIGFAIEQSKLYDERISEYLKMSRLKELSLLQLDESQSIGYTLKAMAAGFWALQQDDFKRAILEIVNEGGDADTNGAVAGGLLGAKLGFSALPKDWIEGLLNKEKLNALIDRLIALMIKTKQI